MTLRSQLLSSFGLQGAGAASVLLATLAIGIVLGPEVQGGFSQTKSEIEFVAAFAMLGLPQALFFYVKSGGLDMRTAMRWALRSVVLALAVGTAYGLIRHRNAGLILAVACGAAVAATVAHGQLRALSLVRERVAWFNVLTALPQMLVLLGVFCVFAIFAAGAPWNLVWTALFGLAYGGVAALAWRRLAAAPGSAQDSQAGWRTLGRYGMATWLVAALSTAAILATQHEVDVRAGAAALGKFTMAMTLAQIPLTPISYAAPLLWRRWMERPNTQALRTGASILFVSLLGVAAVAWALANVWPDLGLGEAYAGATRALAVLLAGGAAEAASRVLTVHSNASGLPWVGVRAEIARWCVLAIGWALPLPSGMLPVCVVWAIAAGAALLVFVHHALAEAKN
ncbi:hypothetical protein ABID97_000433 [Variovorax sp. OAS795]|uniref:hypothetical protein n=1 Tax=Variovorax sp. OAS795 TaxID=3034231 RepID=UPI0033917363